MKHLLVKQAKTMMKQNKEKMENDIEEGGQTSVDTQIPKGNKSIQDPHQKSNDFEDSMDLNLNKAEDLKDLNERDSNNEKNSLENKGHGTGDLEKEVKLLREQVKKLEAKERVMSKRLNKANDESAKKTKIIVTYENWYTEFRKRCQAKTEEAQAQKNALRQVQSGSNSTTTTTSSSSSSSGRISSTSSGNNNNANLRSNTTTRTNTIATRNNISKSTQSKNKDKGQE